ncbi:SseB family protein [Nonomuraea sp. NBC_01738]|uniref:SseB family protein n=1 Tax=Nonomuraea sp. NBC_01738 TaxID=2976003 RepID=UPI002E1227D7|nr:SseB family protein [Nonomuraea sp. NBC_01738]
MEPSSAFEHHLWAAFQAEDMPACLGLLRLADFALPVTLAAAAGDEPLSWGTIQAEGRSWITAYTSAEALESALGEGFTHRVASMAELAAGWPDARWGLAVNPGLTCHFLLQPALVARLVAPPLEQEMAHEPGIRVLQKVLAADEIADLLAGDGRVSGYCASAHDLAHIATPAVLAQTLGRTDALTADGSLNLLRWPVVGAQLYPVPFGGEDEAAMAEVRGWVVEEAPFSGMGYLAGPGVLVREYRAEAVDLPFGAEIWELTADGVEHKRAIFDADLVQWVLTGEEAP